MPSPSFDTKSGLTIFGDTVVNVDQQILPVSPSDDDWVRIYNDTGGTLFLLASSNINGYAKPYVSRSPEWLLCTYDSTNKWTVKRTSNFPSVVVSVDGTLATAQAQVPADQMNVDDLVCFLNTGADGIYQVTDNAGTSEFTRVTPFDSTSTPSYTSQIVGTTTLNLTSGFANVSLSTTDLDGSGSDYTITLASDRIEFDNTDGTKTYKVTYSMDVTSGSVLAPIELRAELDNVLVSRSGASIELAANQEATITKSFIVTPPTSASNNNFLDFLARQNDALPDGAVVEILVLVERVA